MSEPIIRRNLRFRIADFLVRLAAKFVHSNPEHTLFSVQVLVTESMKGPPGVTVSFVDTTAIPGDAAKRMADSIVHATVMSSSRVVNGWLAKDPMSVPASPSDWIN